jgi:hypothetical protein
MINELIKLANALDGSGFNKEADFVDAIIKNAIAAPLAAPAAPAINPAAGVMLLLAILLLNPDIREETKRLIEDLIETILPSYSGEDTAPEYDRGGTKPSSDPESSDEAWPENLEDGFPGDGPSESQSEQVETLRRALEDAKDIGEGDYPIDAEGRDRPSKEDVKRDIDKILKEMDKIFGKKPSPVGQPDDEGRKSSSVALSCIAMGNGQLKDHTSKWWIYYNSSHVSREKVEEWCSSYRNIFMNPDSKSPTVGDVIRKTGAIAFLSGSDRGGDSGEPRSIEDKIRAWAAKRYPNADYVSVRNHVGYSIYCDAESTYKGKVYGLPVFWQKDGSLHVIELK